MNQDYIVDQDPQTGANLAIHRLSEIFSIIRYPNQPKLFGIEYNEDHIYKYESENRENIILDIMELYHRGDHPINTLPVSIEPAARGLREGGYHSLSDPPKEDYAESFMKQHLSHIDTEENSVQILREFLSSYSIAPPLADKNHFRSLMKLLPKVEGGQLQACLAALHRIVFNRSVIEDAPSNKGLETILTSLFQSNDAG
jgi:hypothetical protein